MFSRKEAAETTVVKNEEVEAPKPAPVTEAVVAKVDSMPVDSAPVNTIETATTVPTTLPAVAEPKPVEVSSAKFYVIAGAFKGTKQANVLLAQLTEKGFTKALIIPGDERSKKVKVAVDGFDNESDAYRASNELKKVIGEAGWVFKKK